MKLIRYFFFGLVIATSPAMAGDAYDGELFGYKIGEKYPVTDETKGFFSIVGSWEIVTEHPVKPDEMKEVRIVASAKTFIIGNIFSVTEFDTEKEAKAFAEKYENLLEIRYIKGLKKKSYLNPSRLRLELSGNYFLRVAVHNPDKRKPEFSVHIGLQSCCSKWEKLRPLFDKELSAVSADDRFKSPGHFVIRP